MLVIFSCQPYQYFKRQNFWKFFQHTTNLIFLLGGMVLTMRWSGLKFEIIFESIRLQLSTDQTVRGSLITIKFMQLNTQTFSDLTQLQTLFYTHQDEKYVSKDHSYPLVGGLSPTVSFTLVQTKYLGLPFTGLKKFLWNLTPANMTVLLFSRVCRCGKLYSKSMRSNQTDW